MSAVCQCDPLDLGHGEHGSGCELPLRAMQKENARLRAVVDAARPFLRIGFSTRADNERYVRQTVSLRDALEALDALATTEEKP